MAFPSDGTSISSKTSGMLAWTYLDFEVMFDIPFFSFENTMKGAAAYMVYLAEPGGGGDRC